MQVTEGGHFLLAFSFIGLKHVDFEHKHSDYIRIDSRYNSTQCSKKGFTPMLVYRSPMDTP